MDKVTFIALTDKDKSGSRWWDIITKGGGVEFKFQDLLNDENIEQQIASYPQYVDITIYDELL